MPLPDVKFTEADVHAIRALIGGAASADQQQRGMRFILEHICRIYDSPYVSQGADRDSFVMMGRHQVGILITSTITPRVLEAAIASDVAKVTPTPTRRGTRQNHAKPS